MRTRQCHGWLAWIVLSCLAPSGSSGEPGGAAAPVKLEVFEGPEPNKLSRPLFYPESEYTLRHEGWVQVHMMIDPDGKPYEFTVVDSSGNEMFERAALQIKDWTFRPATLGDQPVDAGYSYKLVFRLAAASDGAGTPFVQSYKRLLRAIDAGDRAAADAEFAKLQVNNLYEDAYRSVGRYQYHRKWGTEAEQLADLKRAVAGEHFPRYLAQDVFADAVHALLTLQLRAKDFASALKTWQTLQKFAPQEQVDKLTPVMAKVEALRTADAAYSVDGEIDKGTSWFYTLFKNRFQIAVASGSVAEIKLRCDKKYVFFRYQPDVQYRISDRYGECALELVGDHGSKFSLVQS